MRDAQNIRIVIEIEGLIRTPHVDHTGDMPQLRITQGDARMDALGPRIDEYGDWLLAKENDPAYVRKVTRKCRRVCTDLGWCEPSHITSEDMLRFLAALKDQNRSAKTRNHWRDAVHGWCGWLTKKGILERNPLDLVPRARVTDEKGKAVPTEAQVRALVDAARSDKRKKDRWLVYLIAAYTGLRHREIERLRVSMFRGGDSPHFVLPAGVSKARKVQQAFMPDWLAAQIADHIKGRELDAPVVVGLPKPESFDRDLRKAGIPKRNERGESMSFHSLRHFFCNWLADADVDQETRQTLMRHGSTRMTAHYTRTNVERLSKKISRIGSSGVDSDDDDMVDSSHTEAHPMMLANGYGGSNPLTPIQDGNEPQDLTVGASVVPPTSQHQPRESASPGALPVRDDHTRPAPGSPTSSVCIAGVEPGCGSFTVTPEQIAEIRRRAYLDGWRDCADIAHGDKQ